MKKRLITLLLVGVLLITATTPAISSSAASSTDSVQTIMDALGIMDTDISSKNVDATVVSRGEYAQLLVNMSTFKDTVTAESNVTLFLDVSKNYWAAGYIKTAINQGWMSGYLNGSFKPETGITLQEAVNGMMKLLGYTSSDFDGSMYTGQMTLYATKEMNKNITKTKNQTLSRSDCMNLFYNTLTTTTKEGKNYGESLGYTIDTNGEIDYLTLVNSDLTGPILVDGDWKKQIPFSLDTASYYKNGSSCNASDLADYDVLYYSSKQKGIWAYDNKVTGTIQSISPNRLEPTSVTIAGKEYPLGTTAMSLEFSSLGSVDVGDIVTVLLGKDESVVGVLGIDELNVTVTGIVLETGQHLVSNANDDLVSTYYAIIVDASGNEYQQDYDSQAMDIAVGGLARITYEGGVALIKNYSYSASYFDNDTFSEDGTLLGKTKLASNVKILDYFDGQYSSVYQQRLAGTTLAGASVYYYELNSKGAIEKLILNNVTGDLYDYGIYKGLVSINSATMTSEYILDGNNGTATSDIFDVENGPLGFIFEGNEITSVMNLFDIEVISMGDTSVRSSSQIYPLADEVDVYFYENGEYLATTLSQVSDLKKYKLTAYYDRIISLGGRVRIIVAENIN